MQSGMQTESLLIVVVVEDNGQTWHILLVGNCQECGERKSNIWGAGGGWASKRGSVHNLIQLAKQKGCSEVLWTTFVARETHGRTLSLGKTAMIVKALPSLMVMS